MALTTCRECKKEVSTDAKTCPHCGTSSPAQKSKPMSAGVGCVLIFFALLVLGAILNQAEKPRTPAEIAAAKESDRLFNLRFTCEEMIRRQLRSPKSAEFEGVQVYRLASDTAQRIVQGKVTAVNAFNAPITSRIECVFDAADKPLSAEVLK